MRRQNSVTRVVRVAKSNVAIGNISCSQLRRIRTRAVRKSHASQTARTVRFSHKFATARSQTNTKSEMEQFEQIFTQEKVRGTRGCLYSAVATSPLMTSSAQRASITRSHNAMEAENPFPASLPKLSSINDFCSPLGSGIRMAASSLSSM